MSLCLKVRCICQRTEVRYIFLEANSKLIKLVYSYLVNYSCSTLKYSNRVKENVRGVFRTLTNLYDGAFSPQRLLEINSIING